MTANTIAYAKYREDKRHNEVTERENERSHRADEGIRRDTLSETQRANRANESFNLMKLGEDTRHNKVIEADTKRKTDETIRHNYAMEYDAYRKTDESIRHNQATEYENWRHNQESESVAWGTLVETQRHNQTDEALKDRDISVKESKQTHYETVEFPAQAMLWDSQATKNYSDVYGSVAGIKVGPILSGLGFTDGITLPSGAMNAASGVNSANGTHGATGSGKNKYFNGEYPTVIDTYGWLQDKVATPILDWLSPLTGYSASESHKRTEDSLKQLNPNPTQGVKQPDTSKWKPAPGLAKVEYPY